LAGGIEEISYRQCRSLSHPPNIPLFIFSIQESPYFRILLTAIALQDVEKHILGHFLALAGKVPRPVHIGSLFWG
jgi:hypothetical protein